LTATVDLPTPPFPDATAMTFLTPESRFLSIGGGSEAVLTTASTWTEATPGTRSAARCTSARNLCRTASLIAGVGRSTKIFAVSPAISTFFTMPHDTTSLATSG
jgi:hypothetical protein